MINWRVSGSGDTAILLPSFPDEPFVQKEDDRALSLSKDNVTRSLLSVEIYFSIISPLRIFRDKYYQICSEKLLFGLEIVFSNCITNVTKLREIHNSEGASCNERLYAML